MTAIELSRNIVEYAAIKECRVTNLKLQKTLYYVQGYFAARYNEPLFEDRIVNWAYGPVVPTAYFQFCSYGASPIEVTKVEKVFDGLTNEQTRFVCKVIEKCLAYPARELVKKTHEETPWKNTNRNQTIEFSSIKDYFKAHDPLDVQ